MDRNFATEFVGELFMVYHDNGNVFNKIVEKVDREFYFVEEQRERFHKNKNKIKNRVMYLKWIEFLEAMDDLLITLGDPHTRLFYQKEANAILPENFEWFNGGFYLFKDGDVVLIENVYDRKMTDIYQLYLNKFIGFPRVMIENEISQDLKMKRGIFAEYHFEVKIYGTINQKETELNLCYIDQSKWRTNIKEELKNSSFAYDTIFIERMDNDTIIIRILTFRDHGLYKKLRYKLSGFKGNYKRIILDIRNNNGGYIDIAKRMAASFVRSDHILDYDIIEWKNKNYFRYNNQISSEILDLVQTKEILVFVNDKTMSSAEYIFLKALEQDGRLVIGEKTAGVTNQAQVHRIYQNLVLQITTKRYFYNDKPLCEGITPHIEICMNPNHLVKGIDDFILWYQEQYNINNVFVT